MKYLIGSLFLLCLGLGHAQAEEKWKGIDETVIGKYAQDRGQPAAEPWLKIEGDLLLFLFTVSGAVGGFVIGYYWHKVFVAGKREPEAKEQG